MNRTFSGFFSVQKVKKDIGDVSILVNNAGVITTADLLSTQDHQIERMFEVNILAHMWVRATTSFLSIVFWERCSGGIFRLFSATSELQKHLLEAYSTGAAS